MNALGFFLSKQFQTILIKMISTMTMPTNECSWIFLEQTISHNYIEKDDSIVTNPTFQDQHS